MKALTLWQPWASLIAVGAKRIETRSWSTRHRGPIAIHASRRLERLELIHLGCCWDFCGALAPLDKRMGDGKDLWNLMPFGAVVAIATLVDCRPTDSFTQAELDTRRRPLGEIGSSLDWTERRLGDFGLGRFGWILADVEPLSEPIPAVGHQGLWNWERP